MKVILVTYPVSPYRGSEFSVSWNYIVNMSKYHELYVLYGTSGNGFGNVTELKEFLSTHKLENVHFIDVQVDGFYAKVLAYLRGLNYKYGSFFQYKYWHTKVYKKAVEIAKNNDIDLIHYLNPIGFKEPSDCWKINSVPYIWGPVQGVENRPLCMYKAFTMKGKVDAVVRLILHNAIMLFSIKIRKAIKRADLIFAATPKTSIQFKAIFGKDTIYLPENGILKMECTKPISLCKDEILNLIWIGSINDRKALIILIDSLKKLNRGGGILI